MKLHGELARDMLLKNGVPHSVSEHQNLVRKIKTEAAQTFGETFEAKDTVMKSMSYPILVLIMVEFHRFPSFFFVDFISSLSLCFWIFFFNFTHHINNSLTSLVLCIL